MILGWAYMKKFSNTIHLGSADSTIWEVAYMKKFSNTIHLGSADSTIWEVYFERKSKSILFLEKRILKE